MTVTAVVGAQWGDEGKGRVVDYLAQRARLVVRFQGGDNAGHTVKNDRGEFALHMIPSGIFNPETLCIIGAGTVVNPDNLNQEMDLLRDAGLDLNNLLLDRRANVVLPYHPMLDSLAESARAAGTKIGTTKRGIGPAYSDKAARIGIRLGDLSRTDYLKTRLVEGLQRANARLISHGQEPLTLEFLLDTCARWAKMLEGRIVDTMPTIRDAIKTGQHVLLEGQLGVMRDLDWGIYPFVTSSNPAVGAACSGAGIPPTAIDEVLGVVKAYSTAVGAGPFVTEALDAEGEKLRDVGREFGATTGRPRRCGWFDGVAIRYATWLNGFTSLSVTKLDILDHFDEIKVCTGYLIDGVETNEFPDTPDLERATPIYETWAGWGTSTRDARTWKDLPKQARSFLHRIAELSGAPIRYVSVGPARAELVVVDTFGADGV